MSYPIYCSKCKEQSEVYLLTTTGTHAIYRCKGPHAHTTWIDKESPAARVQRDRQVNQRPYSAA